jgi:hypothetical protein
MFLIVRFLLELCDLVIDLLDRFSVATAHKLKQFYQLGYALVNKRHMLLQWGDRRSAKQAGQVILEAIDLNPSNNIIQFRALYVCHCKKYQYFSL